jgi:DNA-binding GntR family transcriptional regulator
MSPDEDPISRVTVRLALAKLEEEQLLVSIKGRGWYVAQDRKA